MLTGLTPAMCSQAFDIATSALSVAADLMIANKYAGTLVILKSFAVPSSNDPSKVSLDETREAVLYMRRVDENHPDAAKYDEIALTKARDLWVLGYFFNVKSNRDIQQNFPHLYRPSMTKWHGGTRKNGIVITYSGVQGNFDEAFTDTVDAWLTAMCREEMTRADGVMASPSSFIGLPEGSLGESLKRAM
jgi:hypothetical protein